MIYKEDIKEKMIDLGLDPDKVDYFTRPGCEAIHIHVPFDFLYNLVGYILDVKQDIFEKIGDHTDKYVHEYRDY